MFNAFKNGVTVFSQDVMNSFLSLQPFALIYTGTLIDSHTVAGTTEHSVAGNDYAIRFQTIGSTGVGRIELNIGRDGLGSDLVLEIRGTNFNINGSTEGDLLRRVVVPREFFPTTATYWSIPIDLTGLTSGAFYWIIISRGGDSTNKLDLVGEATANAGKPAYRRTGTTGAWIMVTSIHFRIFNGDDGDLIHGIYGENGYTTVTYADELINQVYRYLPPSDGSEGGIRDVMTYTWTGEILKRGV